VTSHSKRFLGATIFAHGSSHTLKIIHLGVLFQSRDDAGTICKRYGGYGVGCGVRTFFILWNDSLEGSFVEHNILGLPAIGLFGALSIYWNEPKLIIIGGPLLFVLAHLVFLAGMYLAGGKYLMVFFRWATRVTLEKLIER